MDAQVVQRRASFHRKPAPPCRPRAARIRAAATDSRAVAEWQGAVRPLIYRSSPCLRDTRVDFLIPQPNTVLELHMPDGATIRVRRHGNRQGPRLVLSHGNGFAIDAYYPFWRLLSADYDLILFDQRNHGHNPLHRFSHHTQWRMAMDMEIVLRAVASAFGERPTAGIFHSLSTTVSLLHSERYAWPWNALIPIDPPLAPAPDHPLRPLTSHNEIGLSHWARQRQNHFDSHEELAEHFRRARRMRRWVAGAADLMARSITRAAEAGWELVCPSRIRGGDLCAERDRTGLADPKARGRQALGHQRRPDCTRCRSAEPSLRVPAGSVWDRRRGGS